MLKFLILFGGCLMGMVPLLALMAIGYFMYRRPDLTIGGLFYFYIAPRLGIEKPADIVNAELRASEDLDKKIDRQKEPWKDLPLAQVNSTIVTTAAKNLFVIGKILLLELRFPRGGDKNDKRHNTRDGRNREFPMYHAQNGQWLISLPRGEGEEVTWLLLDPMSEQVTSGWPEYLAGTDYDPGPARQFAKNNQKGVLIFNGFPGMDGQSLQARDIVWAYALTRGDTQDVADAEVIVQKTDEGQLEDLPKFVIFVAKVVNKSRDINNPTGDPNSVGGNHDEDATWLVTFDRRGGNGQYMAFTGRVFRTRPTRRHPTADLIEVNTGEHSQEASI